MLLTIFDKSIFYGVYTHCYNKNISQFLKSTRRKMSRLHMEELEMKVWRLDANLNELKVSKEIGEEKRINGSINGSITADHLGSLG
jgi:hypothetical protein